MGNKDFSQLRGVEWECLQSPAKVVDLSKTTYLLPQPESLTVRRDADYSLSFVAEGTGAKLGAPYGPAAFRPGEITSGESVKGVFSGPRTPIDLEGVSSGPRQIRGDGVFSIEGVVYSVRCEWQQVAPHRIVEYCASGPRLGFHTKGTSRDFGSNTKVERQVPESQTPDFWSYQIPGMGAHSGWDSFYIRNKYFEVFCTSVDKEIAPEWLAPISIQFGPDAQAFDKKYRREVLEALSFALGRRLIIVGHTTFDAASNPIEQFAVAPYSENIRKECEHATLAPCHREWETGSFSETTVAQLAEAYLTNRGSLHLDEVIFNWWIARSLPLGMNIVAYTGALEALAAAWLAADPNRSAYIPKDEFKAKVAPAIDVIEKQQSVALPAGAPLPAPWKAVIGKLRNANSVGAADRVRKFLEAVNLPTAGVEKVLLNSRNKYAHGGVLSGKEVEFLVLVRRCFETFLNRVMLKAIGSAVEYIDYSTLDFPKRRIDDPLGGPDGKQKLDEP
jgi:hypothetical protein